MNRPTSSTEIPIVLIGGPADGWESTIPKLMGTVTLPAVRDFQLWKYNYRIDQADGQAKRDSSGRVRYLFESSLGAD